MRIGVVHCRYHSFLCSPSLLYYFRSSELNFSFFILKCKRLNSTFLNGGVDAGLTFWIFKRTGGIHYSTAYKEPVGIKKAELGNERVQCTQLLCRQFRWKHLLHPCLVPPKKIVVLYQSELVKKGVVYYSETWRIYYEQKGGKKAIQFDEARYFSWK